MEAYGISATLVALAEMGDRTQLLAIVLASRYRRPVPILMGILAATVANHTLAAAGGYILGGILSAPWFKALVALSFILMAVWALVPDKDPGEDAPSSPRLGVFLTTALSFFVVEMGDKTQIATAALAARYHDVLFVAAGSTTGMMIANVPAVLLGHTTARTLRVGALRVAAALLYLGLGLWSLASVLGLLGPHP